MALTVTALNTRIKRTAQPGWVRIVYDTGAKDAKGDAITKEVVLTQASVEKSAGVLLPKAQIKAIVQAALNAAEPIAETDLAGAL